jgi:D-glycero-beta-D-manno-heptose-7-phosphate kinase
MIEQTTQQQKQFNILLIGDTCIDEYRYGVVERISPEAPVPIFKIVRVEQKNGMASNVEENLKSLGCNVTAYYGKQSLKTRIVHEKSKQHLLRIDDDVISHPLIIESIDNIQNYDAIVISDYNKGFVSYETIKSLRKKYDGPIFLDTKKKDLYHFGGIYVKINESEFNNSISINDMLIVTLGENGAMLKHTNPWGDSTNYFLYFKCPKVEVSDVTGAGDTFLSALTYQYLKTKNISASIDFAIRASSITVQHFGCYAPTLEEICD